MSRIERKKIFLTTFADFFTGMSTAWAFAAVDSLNHLAWLDLISSNLAKGSLTNRHHILCKKMRLLKLELRPNSSGLLSFRERYKPALQADSDQSNLNSNLREKFLSWPDKQMLRTRFFANDITRRC